MVKIEPISNVDTKRSMRERIGHAISSLLDMDAVVQILGILAGLAFLGFVVTSWVLHLFTRGSYVISSLLAVVGLALSGLALARIPAALIVVFGGAAICATALFMGFTDVLLPNYR